ncbi:hypothetical protein FA10DRAFT_300486 [Acaromyces ingoldii]|uniref:HIT-type domain-containing protein n=1 Tax=Acaromyces ingoldii TaxID=215250 RepID=A0A316YTC1_9BASI|nr:hypothetical protein FA10DRAFT_300486 [Acaromyces ingoldii]PWN91928.1 hypothetical protein FA10DRAFT_300486 [Acaromyces ingoldii]
MSELLSIGRNDEGVKRGGLRGIGVGAPVRRGLVEEVGQEGARTPPLDPVAQQEQEQEQERQARHSSKPRPKCAICHEATSNFTCPACHAPYCTLACYRSPRHSACSQPFSQKTLRDELGEDAGKVDDEERRNMMDVLRRLHNLGADDEAEYNNEAGQEGDEEDGGENANIDIGGLEEATPEQLLELLSPDERARFEAAINDDDPSQARAKALLDGIAHKEEESVVRGPWWTTNDTISPDQAFAQEVGSIQQSLKRHASLPPLEHNIVATLLAYAYLLRHLDLGQLKSVLAMDSGQMHEPVEKLKRKEEVPDHEFDDMPGLEPDVEHEEVAKKGQQPRSDPEDERVARATFDRLAPFVNALPGPSKKGSASGSKEQDQNQDPSKVLLSSVEDASLYLLARLDPSQGALASTMVLLLQDVISLLDVPKIAETQATDRLVCALSDLSGLLPGHGRRKLMFYGAVWQSLDGTRLERVKRQLRDEIQRLKDELERAEDQERWRAAEEATRAGGVVLTE